MFIKTIKYFFSCAEKMRARVPKRSNIILFAKKTDLVLQLRSRYKSIQKNVAEAEKSAHFLVKEAFVVFRFYTNKVAWYFFIFLSTAMHLISVL
jgi:hypothetical protein